MAVQHMEQSETIGVAERTQQGFRLSQVAIDLAEPAEPEQRVADRETQVDFGVGRSSPSSRCSRYSRAR